MHELNEAYWFLFTVSTLRGYNKLCYMVCIYRQQLEGNVIIGCNCSLLKRIHISICLMGSCNCEGNFDGETVILFHLEFGLEYRRENCYWKL